MGMRSFFKKKRRRTKPRPARRWKTRKKFPAVPWTLLGQGGGLLLALLILGAFFKTVDRKLFAFPIFEIRHVELVGLETVEEMEILQRLGLKEEAVLTHVDLSGLQERVLAHPRVEAVSIHKGYPDRLRIEIKERRPVVAVAGKGADWFWVDREGYVLNRSGESPEGLIRFKGAPSRRLAVGDRLDPGQFSSGLALVRVLEQKEAVSDALVVDIRRKGDIHLEMEGVRLQFGDGNFKSKLGRYLDVRDDLRNKGIRNAVIDLRFPDKVVVKTERDGM